jgi:hypothetical protein
MSASHSKWLVPIVAVLALGCAGNPPAKESPSDYHPHIDAANFQTTIDNPYCPLVPGTVFHISEKTRSGTSDNVVAVTHDTKVIMGVTCVVVSDKVTKDGVLEEETLDWYAQDKDGNVWYFGEDTKEYGGNGKVGTKGSWEAGVKGAQPGIIMPGHAVVGDPYRQEYGKGEAEDMGQIVAVSEEVTVPYGTFSECVKTREWSLIDGGVENKWYARGVGFIRSEASTSDGPEVATLVSVTGP